MVEAEHKVAKATEYFSRIERAISDAYGVVFLELSSGVEPDFHLINLACLAVFAKYAAIMAVDEYMTEEKLIEAIKAAYKDAYSNAPKFS
jgi:hypothetical protein